MKWKFWEDEVPVKTAPPAPIKVRPPDDTYTIKRKTAEEKFSIFNLELLHQNCQGGAASFVFEQTLDVKRLFCERCLKNVFFWPRLNAVKRAKIATIALQGGEVTIDCVDSVKILIKG